MERSSVTVAAVESVGPDSIALELRTPDGFDARPGQFVKLVATVDGEEESRFYTISSPTVADTFELTIEIDPEGAVGPRLETLEAGDEVVLSGPYGNAYYEDEEHVLVLAGGPGVGPAIGIAERVMADGGEAAVVYRDDYHVHGDRLAALEEQGGTVILLDPGDSLGEALAEVDVETAQVFVYGFVDFLDDAMDAIADAGGTPDTAKVENFG